MKIENPNAVYWPQTNMYEHIANIASVCYHSPKKEGEKAKKMVENLIKRKHLSPTRHASCYFITPLIDPNMRWDRDIWWLFNENDEFITPSEFESICKYIPYIEVYSTNDGDGGDYLRYYIATNYNFLLDNPNIANCLKQYQVTPEEFMKECPELMRFTFCLTTQLSTSREINRKSPNCIMEESTRYILYSEDGKAEPAIVRPHWMTTKITKFDSILEEDYEDLTQQEIIYLNGCADSFNRYASLIDQGLKQEDARGVLPTDTKTTVIYTYSVKEWSDIFKLRYLDMTGKAHPNCKVIMQLVLNEFNKLGYELNENGDLVYNIKED